MQQIIVSVFPFDQCGKCSKIFKGFLFLFSTKMLVIGAEIHKVLVRIANREDPDQTASTDAFCLGLFVMQRLFKILVHHPYILVYAEDEEVDQHPLLNIFLPHHQYISH